MPTPIKKIVCIGAGYVGGPTMTVIADRCANIQVTVVDMNTARIAAWNSASLPVYEPGLAEIVEHTRGRNLHFIGQNEGAKAVAEADAVFISVNTPTKTHGEGAGRASDLSFVESCAQFIAQHALGHTIVIEKSTMPVRAADTIKKILAKGNHGTSFDVLSNPEFLAEGTAIRDLEKPDRVLIGGENPEAVQALADVYAQWVPRSAIITTGLWSAELSKLAANAFLAQRVSSINAISSICEVTEADVEEVAQVVGADSRVGPKFLKASIGFGGSCFKKDVLSLVYLCEHYQLPEAGAYWEQVLKMNEWQKQRITDKVIAKAKAGNGTVAVLGLAFKKNTNDFRESPAIDTCNQMLQAGLKLKLYDAKVNFAEFAKVLLPSSNGSYTHATSAAEAMQGASAIFILTEWDEFKTIDWKNAAKAAQPKAGIFDGRAIIDVAAAKTAGFTVYSVGKAV